MLVFFSTNAKATFDVYGFKTDGTGQEYCKGMISGTISKRTGKDLYNFLHAKVDPKTCKLDNGGILGSKLLKVIHVTQSKGGDLLAAITIISMMQDYKIAAETWDRGPKYRANMCNSSCAIIFAGAPFRHYVIGINKGSQYPPISSKFGLHKPEFLAPESTFKSSVEREMEYDQLKYKLIEIVGKVGVKADFIIKTFETSNNDVFVPLYVDLLMWNVVTSKYPYDPKNAWDPYYK